MNVSNPALPTQVGSFGEPYIGSNRVSGNYDYTINRGHHIMEIINVTNPAAPTIKSSIVNGGNAGINTYQPSALAVTDPYIFLTGGQGMNSYLQIIRFIPITIASFSPSSGLAGSSVTITGTNFSATPANNIVKFNGVTATVTASTSTSLTVTVPTGATNGPIVISQLYQAQTAISSTNFVVNPTVVFTSPNSGTYGGTIALSVNKGGSTGAVTYTVANGTGSATVSGSTLTLTGAGTVTVTATVAADANYGVGTANQTITINKANQTITFNALPAKTYGDAPFAVSATATSGLPVSFNSSNALVATLSGTTIIITGAGSSTITASQAGNANYNAASNVPQTLVVSKAVLTATADGKSKTYGSANPSLTYTPSGFVNGESAGVIDVAPSISTTAVTCSNAGGYSITPSGGADNNYSFNYVN